MKPRAPLLRLTPPIPESSGQDLGREAHRRQTIKTNRTWKHTSMWRYYPPVPPLEQSRLAPFGAVARSLPPGPGSPRGHEPKMASAAFGRPLANERPRTMHAKLMQRGDIRGSFNHSISCKDTRAIPGKTEGTKPPERERERATANLSSCSRLLARRCRFPCGPNGTPAMANAPQMGAAVL